MVVGSVYRRCSCRNQKTGKAWGTTCPKLARNNRHGVWNYRVELPPDKDGKRRPRRRGGFASADAAQAELDRVRELLAIPDSDDDDSLRKVGDLIATVIAARETMPPVEQVRRLVHAAVPGLRQMTVGQWLAEWLPTKKNLSRNGRRLYEAHIRLYLVRYLSAVRLDRLRVAHVSDMFDQIIEHNDEITAARASKNPKRREAVKWEQPVGPTSMQRIRGTLRAALNDAIREGLITMNAAALAQLPAARRPKPMVWTAERVARWGKTGKIPSPVMVWTPVQTGRFLDHAVHDRLYPLFHLIAHRGLRRGEACGLRWIDTHLDAQVIEIVNTLLQWGWETGEAVPKTASSEAPVALDADTVMVLRDHRARQEQERTVAGELWVDSGLVFTKPDGSPLHPADVTDHFRELAAQAGLPPIRLHDLRHGAATLALAAGVEMKVVQEMLRHSSITVTSDLYTSVLPEVALAAAEATALIIPRTRSALRGIVRDDTYV